jgi:alkanesulfonate monooxygenase SsuD/methylene tetrahydromethanopterin reductase-like flavin-dependent oxidoreductase (luciferase family)
MEMFGLPLQGHDERYDCAEEWLTIVKKLWSEDETFDFQGRFYNIKKGYLQPKPIQFSHPAIMNAGGSERGRHFATKNCDLVFTGLRTFDFDVNAAHIKAYHRMAREEYNREVRAWGLAVIVQGETEKEARDFYNYFVHAKGDWDAAMNVVNTMAAEINERDYPPERRKAMAEMFIAGWGGFPLVGTKEQIVDGLRMMSRLGLDGVLLSWPRFEQGMREFRDVTLPLLKQAGLRDFL